MKTIKFSLTLAVAATIFAAACKKPVRSENTDPSTFSANKVVALSTTTFTENFEVGTTSPKTSYDVSPSGTSGDDVTLQSKSWNMYEALIGNLSGDKKSGSWSARVRNSGKITMQFDLTTGIGTVSVDHATYGTDAASKWELWYSTNSQWLYMD